MGSFSTPLSGLKAAQGQLQSVSNNLANLNTDGYKDQTLYLRRHIFSDRRHQWQWRSAADGFWRRDFFYRRQLH